MGQDQNFKESCVQKKLIKSDAFLFNHQVFQKGIYPAVSYLELALAAVEWFPHRIMNVSWNSPLFLEEEEQEKTISLRLKENKKGYDYRITSESNAHDLVHSSGILIPPGEKKEWDVRNEGKNADLEKISSGMTHRWTRSEIYPYFHERGITYQNFFQCLEELHFEEDEALGKINGIPGNLYKLDPAIMDGVMQTILAVLFKTLEVPTVFVPFSFKEMVLRQSHLPGTCWAHVKAIDINPGEGFARFNALLLDEDGNRLIEISDICMKVFLPSGYDSRAVGPRSPLQSKWAVAASFTAEPIYDALCFWRDKLGLTAEILFAPYNQVFQELLNPGSLLSRNASGINIVLIRLEDFAGKTLKNSQDAESTHTGLSMADKEKLLAGKERYRLANGLEIAHLNTYETQYLYDEIFIEQTYLKNNIRLEDGDVVIDIGANIGMFSLFVAHHYNNIKLYSFEPSPDTFEVLKTNLALYAPDAIPCNSGISSENTTGEFTFYPQSSVFSGFHAEESGDEEALRTIIENTLRKKNLSLDEITIKTYAGQLMESRLHKQTYTCELKNLAAVFKEYEIGRVDLLKVDAEKCEWEVLMGIAADDWDKIKQIVIEVHDTTGELYKRIGDLLAEKGFQVEVVKENLLEGSGLGNIYGKRPDPGTGVFKSRFR
ncbi:MAG: FkbM family methyltransferase, partial [Acidobacteria bacterium]|nr:FkbM family methyltransferase [Acidobacteriota bacterium]